MKRFLAIHFLVLASLVFFGPVTSLEARPYVWKLIEKIRPKFNVYHPQGLAKIGERFYLSSVEVKDKKKGQGVGHLFEFNKKGDLLRQIQLMEGVMYHPGGIDYDGRSLWVPVSEYKKRSQGILYQVDLKTFKAKEAFRVRDHIGAVVYNREMKTVVGMNWGARAFYEWTPEGKLIRKVLNEVDDYSYQDCNYLDGPAMICAGVRGNANGGIAVVDLIDFSLIQDIQFVPRTHKQKLMTRNPMTVELVDGRLLYYFLPEDNYADLYVFEIK